MKIPYKRQENDFYCGPASMQMVYTYFRKKTTQKQLGKRLKTRRFTGTKNSELVRVAVEDGFSCFVKMHARIADLRDQLKKDHAVIINFIEPVHEYGHFAVVKRIGEKKIVLADPWNGDNFEMKIKDFKDRWHGSKNIYQQWFVALSLD